MELKADQLLSGLPLGAAVTESDGRIIAVNDALRHLLGYETSEITGSNVINLATEEHRSDVQNLLDAMENGALPGPRVLELRAHSGSSVPVEIHVGKINDDKPHAVLVVKNLSKEMELLQDLQRRSAHLLASSEVSRATTQILEVQDLLTKCVDLIRLHFGFYYAAIFLINSEGKWAKLKAATGDAGQQLLTAGHQLAVGSQSMVGWVTANNAARIALDVGEEAIRFDNPALPKTRSEMALPLRVRGQVIGALDVQSTTVNAFSDEDIRTIQMMADQVAIAIDNARLFAGQKNGK